MASGITVADSCLATYNEIQKSKKHRYAILYIKNEREIEVEKVGDRDSTFNDFKTDLMQKDGNNDDCRYGLMDYEYKFNANGVEPITRNKLFLMCWCPDTSKIKKKMVYSASFDTLKKAFRGVHKTIQANDESKLEQSTIEEILTSNEVK